MYELCNLSMTLESFSVKSLFNIKPLLNKGSKMDPSNNRPVSLFPFF